MLEGLKPERVFWFFERICGIPHGSYNEKALSDFIRAHFEGLSFDVWQDEVGNIIINKPASLGYEHLPGVVMQAHLDMVCEALPEVAMDFKNNPITLVLEGDKLHASGTTLGGDDGIGSAMIMAVLEDKTLAHPPIQAIFTVMEEVGLEGAKLIPSELIQGKYLINIDSDQEGVFLAGCAGGITVEARIAMKYTDFSCADNTSKAYTIAISGLHGGHSGMDINKERGNAIMLLGRTLEHLMQYIKGIAHITGGTAKNAIPREAEAVVVVGGENAENFTNAFETFVKGLKAEFADSDSGLNMELTPTSLSTRLIDTSVQDALMTFLTLFPNGVDSMNTAIPGLVNSSTNLGVVKTDENTVLFVGGLRSSLALQKADLLRRVERLSEATGAELSTLGDYPGWAFDPKSELQARFRRAFNELYGKEPIIEAVHSGLECGLFIEKAPQLDAISFGAGLLDIHTPKESVSVASVARVYELLKKVLADMK